MAAVNNQPMGSVMIPKIKFAVGINQTDEDYIWDGIRNFDHNDVEAYLRATRQHQKEYPQVILQASAHFTPLAQNKITDMILCMEIDNYKTLEDTKTLWKEATNETLIQILQALFKNEEITEADKIKQAIAHACITMDKAIKSDHPFHIYMEGQALPIQNSRMINLARTALKAKDLTDLQIDNIIYQEQGAAISDSVIATLKRSRTPWDADIIKAVEEWRLNPANRVGGEDRSRYKPMTLLSLQQIIGKKINLC